MLTGEGAPPERPLLMLPRFQLPSCMAYGERASDEDCRGQAGSYHMGRHSPRGITILSCIGFQRSKLAL